MALLGSWLSSAGREERAVLRALEELSAHKTPVRAEAEGTGVSFFTVLSLRKNGLVVARPRTLRVQLTKESLLRLTLPNRDRKQVRVPVLVPLVKLPFSVKRATVCGVPDTYSGACQRKADRFSTTRFSNLNLFVPSANRTFRVVDLSTAGLRILTGEGVSLTLFEPEAELGPARLRVGQRVNIELESLVPRAPTRSTVGFSMRVARDGASERYLLNLLNRLQEAELRRLQIDSS